MKKRITKKGQAEKPCLSLFCLLFVIFSGAVSNIGFSEQDTIVPYPSDFQITAISGGVAPWEPMHKLEISATGDGIYSVSSRKDREEGVFVEKDRFRVDRFDLEFLFENIKKNDFFSLQENYRGTARDGSFAELTITADGKTHHVRTQNIAVKPFDDIAVTINVVTPGGRDMVYNEIL